MKTDALGFDCNQLLLKIFQMKMSKSEEHVMKIIRE